jgi:large subunit ribosomal protein L21
MYAVIQTGGKQYRVSEGQRLEIERVAAADDGTVSFSPVLVVDGETVLAAPAQLVGAAVQARVVGEMLGPKIRGFTYKPKTNQRRRWGHRQRYATIEITGITASAAGAAARPSKTPEAVGEG